MKQLTELMRRPLEDQKIDQCPYDMTIGVVATFGQPACGFQD